MFADFPTQHTCCCWLLAAASSALSPCAAGKFRTTCSRCTFSRSLIRSSVFRFSLSLSLPMKGKTGRSLARVVVTLAHEFWVNTNTHAHAKYIFAQSLPLSLQAARSLSLSARNLKVHVLRILRGHSGVKSRRDQTGFSRAFRGPKWFVRVSDLFLEPQSALFSPYWFSFVLDFESTHATGHRFKEHLPKTPATKHLGLTNVATATSNVRPAKAAKAAT